jgi:hypothetical protein
MQGGGCLVTRDYLIWFKPLVIKQTIAEKHTEAFYEYDECSICSDLPLFVDIY